MDFTAIVVTLSGWIPGIRRLLREKWLTKREKGLLKMAVDNKGQIWVLETDQTNEFVRIGSHDLYDKEDPEVQANYIEALQRLVRRGLVTKKSNNLYLLTGTGFRKAKKLRKPYR